ncbi:MULTISPECIES: ABC transporter ATP-binding protein [Desulfococcus]|jgi:branched-chain amino acid transport system ATP-binding protein|uniref:ABC transporter related protein n=1 Tax=Desulfococcus multivorans DSM 2059 TaxID=1121405 RepID=S7TR61_DESML|nr:ABC transporter ATP-binding protein [Desulfococcus multivorans]AOY58938.1 LivG2: high-affinity branched-chain amino acid transport system, ATP-binding protein [Desulfococcus multivorans]AQV02994.1 ABC transporter ATP-binding protein [Desulfococcus multivorans]EPR39155.1 ABC transporter related protein [Desulfococcus multivorans DSM 2059]MDX9819877.1 ABC transporter ATP-binding protein [Desulfococcus multivorans]SJZ53653.1 amino acid/amide ABC transporter ATP-binding protein 1, HAAT family [
MNLLEINGLTQNFGGLCALSDFSIRFEGGELTGLIGPNGAGKTTVFNLTSGFYRPSGGDIRFKGRSIVGLRPHQITGMGIARTFQNIRLWNDMTVLDNIRISQHYSMGYALWDALMRTVAYGRGEQRIHRTAMEILEALDLRRYATELPRNLPYGIQRKVEIARALSVKPSLLLLDEPAAGLNSADIQGLIQLIQWIHDTFDVAIWMIEHQMAVVMKLCSWIKVIDFGVTIAEGTPDEIQNNPDVIKAYLGDDTI